MGKRGPKPKPTALRVLDGTHRADRHGDPALEPGVALTTVPPAPAELGAAGQQVWETTLADMLPGGYVTTLDLRAFTAYCRTFDELARIERAMKGKALFYKSPKGSLLTHPLVIQKRQWLLMQRQLGSDLWLNPTARAGKQGAAKKETTGGGIKPRRRT